MSSECAGDGDEIELDGQNCFGGDGAGRLSQQEVVDADDRAGERIFDGDEQRVGGVFRDGAEDGVERSARDGGDFGAEELDRGGFAEGAGFALKGDSHFVNVQTQKASEASSLSVWICERVQPPLQSVRLDGSSVSRMIRSDMIALRCPTLVRGEQQPTQVRVYQPFAAKGTARIEDELRGEKPGTGRKAAI